MSADVFSKVSRRMWRDEKFVALSAPQPNARDLWIYLLTGPHNTAIPGLFVKGVLGLAEDLDWDPDATRACLQEIVAQGMVKVDRRRKLVWLPNALQHNLPKSPKNVAGWAAAWRLLPECDLLNEAAEAIRVGLAAKNPKLADTFEKVVGGQSPPVDDDLLDEDRCSEPPPSRPSSPGPGSDPNRILDGILDPVLDAIQPASKMPSQEKEKEKEKSPTETNIARVAPCSGHPEAAPPPVPPDADCSRADGPRIDEHGAPATSRSAAPQSPRLPAFQGQRTGKPRRGRRGATDAPTADQRYRAAYEAGVRDAAPGQAFSLPPGKVQSLLGPALAQHAREPDGPLTGDALDAWIRRTAREFRRAVDGSGQYWSGYGVPGFVRWLNSGRPRAASGQRQAPRVDDRPERYGETAEEFEARMKRDQARFLERAERDRAARLASMTPEQRALEEELPL